MKFPRASIGQSTSPCSSGGEKYIYQLSLYSFSDVEALENGLELICSSAESNFLHALTHERTGRVGFVAVGQGALREVSVWGREKGVGHCGISRPGEIGG